MIFIFEVLVTSIIFVFLFYWIIWKPLATISYLIRIIPYKLTGGRINFFLRRELIALGLHKPGQGWYIEDVLIRDREKQNNEIITQPPEMSNFYYFVMKATSTTIKMGEAFDQINPNNFQSRYKKQRFK